MTLVPPGKGHVQALLPITCVCVVTTINIKFYQECPFSLLETGMFRGPLIMLLFVFGLILTLINHSGSKTWGLFACCEMGVAVGHH